MIDKESFRKTEKKLYNYYGKEKKINSINRKIELLKSQITEIDRKIKETDINIPEESRSITYEERVQSSGDGSSYAEKTAIRIISSLERERSLKLEEIALLEEELRTIAADCCIIGANIGYLKTTSQDFLKTKYGNGHMSDWQVGNALNMSQATAYRTRVDLVEDVSRWEDWLRNKKTE